MINLIDVHCHLGEERILSNLDIEISDAKEAGISKFVSNALCQEEFELINSKQMRELKDSIFWTAGIHPYYDKSSEDDIESLIKFCDEKRIIAIGEIGLDKRNTDFEWQKKMLLMQLDLAANYNLPVVLHTVRQYYELHKILKNNFPNIRGFLHAFNASQEVFETFSQYDLGFSLNAKHPQDKVLRSIIKHEYYFFETDAPYMKSPGSNDDYNHLKNLRKIIEQISVKTEIDLNILLERQKYNVRNLFETEL